MYTPQGLDAHCAQGMPRTTANLQHASQFSRSDVPHVAKWCAFAAAFVTAKRLGFASSRDDFQLWTILGDGGLRTLDQTLGCGKRKHKLRESWRIASVEPHRIGKSFLGKIKKVVSCLGVRDLSLQYSYSFG
jgi:hypothetical protein